MTFNSVSRRASSGPQALPGVSSRLPRRCGVGAFREACSRLTSSAACQPMLVNVCVLSSSLSFIAADYGASDVEEMRKCVGVEDVCAV